MILLFTKALLNIMVLIALYLVGNGLLVSCNTAKTPRLTHIFLSIFAALLVTITVWAITKTGFKTIFLATIPIVAWAILNNPSPFKKPKISELLSGLPMVAVLITILIFLIEILFFNNYQGLAAEGINIPEFDRDIVFLSNVSAHLNEMGFENNKLNYVLPAFSIYHNSELWLNSLLNSISGGSYLRTFLFQTFPVFFVIIWLGFAAIAETLIKGKSLFYYVAVSVICLAIAPVAALVDPFSSVLKGDVYCYVFSQTYKLAIIQAFAVAGFLVRRNTGAMIFLGALLMLFYPTTAPAISISIFAYLALQLFKYKKLSKKEQGLIIAMLSIYSIIAILIIKFGGSAPAIEQESLFQLYIGQTGIYIKTIINIMGSTILKILVTCSPYLLLAIFIHKNIDPSVKKAFYIFLFVQLMGVFTWAIFCRMPDAVQFWTNFYCPAINIILFAVVMTAFADKRNGIKAAAVLLLLVNFYYQNPVKHYYHPASPEEKAIIKKVIAAPDAKIAFIKHPDEFKTLFEKNTNCTTPANYLAFYLKTYTPSCINLNDVKLNDYWEKVVYYDSPFGRFATNKNLSLEQLQLEYINANNIKLLIASEAATVPESLVNLTDTVIFDTVNKIRLVVLK